MDSAARAERARPSSPVNDTWIAACCLVRNLPLATLNVKDFRDFVDHEGLPVIGINERSPATLHRRALWPVSTIVSSQDCHGRQRLV